MPKLNEDVRAMREPTEREEYDAAEFEAEEKAIMRIINARAELSHTTDGPITRFVLIARACELAAKGEVAHDVVANALYEELAERGLMAFDQE